MPLTQLVQAGVCHGDFDWPGLRIGNYVIREFGAERTGILSKYQTCSPIATSAATARTAGSEPRSRRSCPPARMLVASQFQLKTIQIWPLQMSR
jgi:hypothetical protein